MASSYQSRAHTPATGFRFAPSLLCCWIRWFLGPHSEPHSCVLEGNFCVCSVATRESVSSGTPEKGGESQRKEPSRRRLEEGGNECDKRQREEGAEYLNCKSLYILYRQIALFFFLKNHSFLGGKKTDCNEMKLFLK